eukprot:m.15411 g.15411  ORF g.15411 m.15411 type:complete len:209 (+) comp9725_c0_seq1:27-653(+)
MLSASSDATERRVVLAEEETKLMNKAQTSVLRWVASFSDPNTDSDADYQKILQSLSWLETILLKADLVVKMNQREREHYDVLFEQIGEQIETSRNNIEDSKKKLEVEKQVKLNRQEYDALAKVIEKHPPREDTIRATAQVEKELQELEDKGTALESKLQLRKKQFHLLSHAINELKRDLQDESEKPAAEDDNAAEEDNTTDTMDVIDK